MGAASFRQQSTQASCQPPHHRMHIHFDSNTLKADQRGTKALVGVWICLVRPQLVAQLGFGKIMNITAFFNFSS